jgi:hypothetical protein
MSVGGHLIDITHMRLPQSGRDVVRLWVVDSYLAEVCVYAEPQESMPALGDEIWWQSGRIMFDGDRQTMCKVGYSFSAPAGRLALAAQEGGEKP